MSKDSVKLHIWLFDLDQTKQNRKSGNRYWIVFGWAADLFSFFTQQNWLQSPNNVTDLENIFKWGEISTTRQS